MSGCGWGNAFAKHPRQADDRHCVSSIKTTREHQPDVVKPPPVRAPLDAATFVPDAMPFIKFLGKISQTVTLIGKAVLTDNPLACALHALRDCLCYAVL